LVLIARVATAFVLVLACVGPQPPSRPLVGGPGAGQPGETLRFWVRSVARNRGNLAYQFDWGDGSKLQWTPERASGETLTSRKVYADTGSYLVRAKARDETGLESDWSEPLMVRVAFLGPVTPSQPQGPAKAYPDTFLVFTVGVEHVRAESVSVQFDWGDTVGDWSPFVRSGAVVRDSHSYKDYGEYEVKARARDRAGNVSPWSVPASVVVGYRPVAPPFNLRLAASAGVFVKLRWDRGRNDDCARGRTLFDCARGRTLFDSVQFAVWFRPLDSTGFRLVDTTMQTVFTHDPIGWTGDYTVSARFKGEERFAAETVSTVPVFTDTLVLHELNAAGFAGYGWDSLTFVGRQRSLLDTGQARLVDFYFTDFTPGFSGPSYYVASPHLGPIDPGGIVPPGNWRRTAFFGLWGNVQDPLPEYDSLSYQNYVDITSLQANVAVHLPEGYYALVSTFNPNPNDGSVRVRSWFQKVKGLRLIRHRE